MKRPKPSAPNVRSNLIPGIGIVIAMMISFGILPIGAALLFMLFFGHEVLRWEPLMTRPSWHWLVIGTLAMMGLVVLLRTVFVYCSRRITANNVWNAKLLSRDVKLERE